MAYLRSAFSIVLGTYGVVLALDLLRPGLASRVFVVHLLLVLALGLFAILLAKGERWGDRGMPQALVWIFGVVLSWVGWRIGVGMEEGRALLALVGLLIPYTIDRILLQVF